MLCSCDILFTYISVQRLFEALRRVFECTLMFMYVIFKQYRRRRCPSGFYVLETFTFEDEDDCEYETFS